MNRFFLTKEYITEDIIRFPADISHQIARVLRLNKDSAVIVLDNLGNEYLVVLEEIIATECKGRVVQKKHAENEAQIKLNLLVSLTQREKFEFILQKCTEIGVQSITPFISKRSLVNKSSTGARKKERWDRIIKEAAEQSGRGIIPLLSDPLTFADVVTRQSSLNLIAWEEENRNDIKRILKGSRVDQVSLMIGPEGGFEKAEVEKAAREGWIPISFGKRIMRMETAAIVGSALILYELGGLDLF